MKAMNFYTQNGWAGSNYDSKLSTKEIAAKVRSYAKKNFPEFKFSIRTEWSMYADSMAVELKAGPCVPFVAGSRSAERGYMSTMSSVKAWKDELTPEVFAALNAVSNYASSFRYDDSDGMQDYYDTNFYLKIKVSDEYKVIEPKAKKSSVKPEKVEEAKEVEAVTVEGLEIVDYSEKAIAVFGDTKAIKEQLKELGGRFNPALNYNGEKRAGWIFSKKKADEVRNLMASEKVEAVEELPALPEEIYIPGLEEETKQPEKLGNIHLTETDNFNGVRYYDIEGAGIITSAKVRADIQPGDVFNVYTAEERKYCVTYDGVSAESSLKKGLPGIIEFNDKIESGTLSVSSYYTPMDENVEFYEKKVKGKRYTVKDKPLTLGYYGILDNLDNCIIECYPTKEEAEREAEILNGFTDGNGRLKTVI
ncbi:LPD29 domain-containing protein [Phocaeicola vulgatus]|uniref:LPD29 domain-containing protein n=1 Tax=Phocaeicola vulgatus TaxID=821 RepID=UPI00189CFBD3